MQEPHDFANCGYKAIVIIGGVSLAIAIAGAWIASVEDMKSRLEHHIEINAIHAYNYEHNGH